MSIETISVKNARELEQIVVGDMSAIEKGLTVIGSQIPINASTKLDILCHDENGTLVIFQLSTEEDDAMLFEALKGLSYLDTAKHMMKFYYSNFKINDTETPRLVLLAPSFSKNLLTIASHLTGLRIDLYEWEYLKFGDQKGLRIKPIPPGTLAAARAQDRRAWKEQAPEKPVSTVSSVEAPEKKEDKEQGKKRSLLRI